MTTTIIAPFHGTRDHDNFPDEALRVAEQSCRAQGLRLTVVRRQVLALVWQSHKPQRAYDVLKGLEAYGHRPGLPAQKLKSFREKVTAETLHTHRGRHLRAVWKSAHLTGNVQEKLFLKSSICRT